ncbi:MAG: PAS domain S-box protein, partial [Candidatus Hodarchaeales archaeon]
MVEAEERLKKSEARYQNLYDSAPIPCFSISYTGDIIAANKAAETFTGYSEEEMKGMKIVDLYSE